VAQGFVLPAALELRTWLLGRAGGSVLKVRSLDEPGEVSIDLFTGNGSADGWGLYARAIVLALIEGGHRLTGFDGIIASDVPRGAGLSSSHALEVGLAMAVLVDRPEPGPLAVLCQRAENAYVGVQSGIMDPLTSIAGERGHALLIDCRSLVVRPVPIPAGLAIVVVDTGVRRSLTDGRYNEVRSDLDQAARLLGVNALRDVDQAQFDAAVAGGVLTGSVLRRARHVISENGRTLAAADALEAGRLDEVATLFAASHLSLHDDLGVTIPELDTLVEIARATDGVVAARMTGGGFGGCTVNLVRTDAAEAAAAAMVERYDRQTGRSARAWVSRAGDGAGRATWHG
jgi:galactokinase